MLRHADVDEMMGLFFLDLYEDRWNAAKLKIFHVTVTGKFSGFILYDSFMLCRGSVREVCDFILKVLDEESFFF